MRSKVRAALDAVDAVLVEGGIDAIHLWDILSAQRGPDTDDYGETIKDTYTVPIRRAAFPRLAKLGEAAPIPARFTTGPDHLMRADYKDAKLNHHYVCHINFAVSALEADDQEGLKL